MNKSRIFFENTYPVAGKTVTAIQPGQVTTKHTKTAKRGAARIHSRMNHRGAQWRTEKQPRRFTTKDTNCTKEQPKILCRRVRRGARRNSPRRFTQKAPRPPRGLRKCIGAFAVFAFLARDRLFGLGSTVGRVVTRPAAGILDINHGPTA